MRVVLLNLGNKSISGMQITRNHIQTITSLLGKGTVIQEETLSKTSLQTADIILTSSLTQIDLKKVKKLQWVHLTSAGVDGFPPDFASSHIILTNSSGVHPIPIAEHVFGMLLYFVRDFHEIVFAQQKRLWLKKQALPNIQELHGKTLCIVGAGRIGERVATLGKAFSMTTLGVSRDRRKKSNEFDKLAHTKNDIDSFLRQGDFVINILPLTKVTFHYFNELTFRKMKRGAVFVNVGRGKTVDENALIKALRSAYIKAAALDVFEEEPLPKNSPLWSMPNVLITPHSAGITPAYIDRVIEIFCENLRAFLKNQPLPNRINFSLGY